MNERVNAAESAHGADGTASPTGEHRVAARPAGAYGFIKRAADVLTSGVLLVAGAPLLVVIAVAIRLDSPGPALFRQRRSGRASREFVIFKFRTMKTGTPDLAST
jgi:lipopolysaccharide/colanic/teichoic acid biosynthesis glycosyltransferase